MAIHEECGVFGVIQPEPANVGRVVYYGLYALQHRGQESCGIVVNDDGVFASHKDLGLVGEVFGRDVLERFPQGTMAVGHTRYGTTGASNRRNCQPIEVNHQKGRMALAHNGNLSNAAQLRSKLELTGAIFHTTSDTETIAYIVTRERLTSPSIEDALSAAMKHLEGAYSLVLMSPQKLICVRDPHGFRPLCYGKLPGGGYAAASESCALTAVGAEFVRDLEPGEILIFQGDTVSSRREHCGKCPPAHCVFEHIYFARPDSVIDGVSVHAARLRAGSILAEAHPVEADAVVGVPDSGLDAALGYSRTSGIPYEIGLIKNKYIGRTFIAPGQEYRLGSGAAEAQRRPGERSRKACGPGRRFHRPGNHQRKNRRASPGGRRGGDPSADIRAPLSEPMLLWDGHRFPGKSHRLSLQRGGDCRYSRSRFSGLPTGIRPGRALRRPLQRLLYGAVSHRYSIRYAEGPI